MAKERLCDTLFLQAIKDAGLPEPVGEYHFLPGRRFRNDFAWPEQKVMVELEGAMYAGNGQLKGGHTDVQGFYSNMEKYTVAACMGWKLLRVGPNDANHPAFIALLRWALTGVQPTVAELGQVQKEVYLPYNKRLGIKRKAKSVLNGVGKGTKKASPGWGALLKSGKVQLANP